MASAIGWYGPLIDLSSAASHIGDFVQLLVFVHRSTPVQYRLSKGGEVIRTDIQVGDDSRPFFSISLWQKQMGSAAVAGDVILLQNVKIIKFGNIVEARTVHCSSLQRLIHPYESLVSKGVDNLIVGSRAGIITREKLRRVIKWVQRAGSELHKIKSDNFTVASQELFTHIRWYMDQKRQLSRNWKEPEDSKSLDCLLLSELSHVSNSCTAIFNAAIGEIFLPITWRVLGDPEKEKMFVSRRLFKIGDNSLTEDLICTGCQLCGSPLDLEDGSIEKNSVPLYCPKSSNRLHAVNLIYRPFMLYVWDESDYMPLLVRNKAAELLFGNISAERVYSSYKEQKDDQKSDPKYVREETHPIVRKEGVMDSSSSDTDKGLERMGKLCQENTNFYMIWLILLKVMLQQGRNSPLKFEITINTRLDKENGRFEMVSVSIPCIRG